MHDLTGTGYRTMDNRTHWEGVYTTKAADEVSWYQSEPTVSLELISAAAPDLSAPIIDVGGGASVLVDRLLAKGFAQVAVLDVAESALEIAKARLGPAASRVQWICGDMMQLADIGAFRVWHDRAVFHFLVHADDRQHYVNLARKTVPVGGHVIIATFSLQGPERCSGLPICRYSARALADVLGDGFELSKEIAETHVTPSGKTQEFQYAVFQRV